MFKKIKMFNKLCKIIEAIEAFYEGKKDRIEKVKDYIIELKELAKMADDLLKKSKDKIQQ